MLGFATSTMENLMFRQTPMITLMVVGLVYLAELPSAKAGGDPDIANHGEAQVGLTDHIDKQVNELDNLFFDYKKFEVETEQVINGLNNLGLYFTSIRDSLIRTKTLISNISAEYQRAKNENIRLRSLINIDRVKIDDFINYMDEQKKWPNRIENYLINLVAGITMLLIGGFIGRYLEARKHRIK